jgi:sialate O-acetylesterase
MGLMLACLCVAGTAFGQKMAEVALNPVFTDHMVLQRESPLRIWGKANPGEPVEVVFAGQTPKTTADKNGDWSVLLAPLKASAEPRPLIARGHNEAAIQDVLVGEVWLCSGQSNMEWGLLGTPSGEKDIKSANINQLRLYSVEKRVSALPQVVFDGAKGWLPCSPENLTKVGTDKGSFSAIGFYFGRELQAKLGVPVGLVQSAWGGTRIEPWTPQDKPAPEKVLKNNIPGAIYNAMIAPIAPMSFRGVLWYQGESNLTDKGAYEQKMKDLIGAWRAVFQNPDMPFYFVEIAPHRFGIDDLAALSELRAAQARVADTVPNTGMIHTLDIPDNLKTVHASNKWQPGERLARLALAKTYGVKVGKSITGPAFVSVRRDGTGAMLSFSDTADALMTTNGQPPVGFEGLVADGQWVPASASIQGDKVLVNVAGQTLSGVRFCWLDNQQSNLRNAEGLPPSPFSTIIP